MPLIDDWLPEFDVGERHDAVVATEPERAIELALAAPVAPDRIVSALLMLRGLPPRGRTIEEFLRGFELERVGRTPTEWAGVFQRRGITIAIDFRAEPIPSGSRIATETRVKAADERALRVFRMYWLAVAPFSALIRRRWLRAVQRAAFT